MPVGQPLTGGRLAREAYYVQAPLPRKERQILVGETKFRGIAQQSDPGRSIACKLSEAVEKLTRFDMKYGPGQTNVAQNGGPTARTVLQSNGTYEFLRFFDRLATDQSGSEIFGLGRYPVIHVKPGTRNNLSL
jgi:hypothetical protein